MDDLQQRVEAAIPAEVERLWGEARPRATHPYLERMGIPNPGGRVRLGLDTLVIPLQTVTGSSMVNLGLVRPDGRVDYVPGAETENVGFYFFDPDARRDPRSLVHLCGDWPTGFSIHDATGLPVFVAFGRSSIRSVAKELRHRLPNKPIIVAATNERWTYDEQGGMKVPNPGFEAAGWAAMDIGGHVAVPDFEDLEGQPAKRGAARRRPWPRSSSR